MQFKFECPACRTALELSHEELAQKADAIRCSRCGDMPSPDIMTAYRNIGRTMAQLYSSGECGGWLHKDCR